MKVDLLGFRLFALAPEVFLDQLHEGIFSEPRNACQPKWLACFNPHSYAVAKDSPSFESALKASTWLVPDGSGVLLASKILGAGIRVRITGSDVFRGLLDRLNNEGGRSVFFLGSTQETLEKIKRKMSIDYPNVQVAGVYSPPFQSAWSKEEVDQMVAAVNQAKPDVLWVAMTAPKQELWIFQNSERLDIRFAAAVGAAFDFYVGNIKRSPVVFQKLGLEWLPRFLQEPRRLWRRMFISAPVFMWAVVSSKFSSKKPDSVS
jgi:N-acetylglucosaminyldiphosphoundecaprenol N-acetyl-beta-D-mannosaminyltransferase